MTRAVDGAAVVIGHLPAGLRPEKLGQLRIPAIERKFKPKPPGQSRYVTVLYRAGRGRLRDTPSCRIWRVGSSHGKAIARTQKCQFRLNSARDGEVFPLGKPVPSAEASALCWPPLPAARAGYRSGRLDHRPLARGHRRQIPSAGGYVLHRHLRHLRTGRPPLPHHPVPVRHENPSAFRGTTINPGRRLRRVNASLSAEVKWRAAAHGELPWPGGWSAGAPCC